MTDPTNQAQTDAAAEDPSADPTNRILNPEPGQGSKNFQGFSTKDGEVVPAPDALNTNTEKPERAAPKKADEQKRDPQKRIDQAVAKQRAAERLRDLAEARAISVEQRLAALESGRTTPALDAAKTATTSEAAPDPKKFEYGEADARYIAALASYTTRQEIAKQEAQRSTAQRTEQQKLAVAERQRVIDEWADKAPADKYDDFQEVVIDPAKAGEYPMSETLALLILESPVGHDLAYAIASDHKEATRLSKMSAARQAAWFGTEEARLMDKAKSKADPAKRVSKAPRPPEHEARGGGEGEPVNASTTSFADFEKLAMAKQ